MKRIFTTGVAAVFSLALAACGPTAEEGAETGQDTTEAAGQMGGEQMGEEQMGGATGQLSMPEWMQVDHDAQTVTLDITAGSDPANNRWNYNGYANGNATIVVPQGYEVTINFDNADPNNPHSLGIDERPSGSWPTTFQNPTPVFEGAITQGATSMTEGTMSDESETITFTTGQAGEYTMVCYIPAHAATGMWINFNVSADGEAGVRTSA